MRSVRRSNLARAERKLVWVRLFELDWERFLELEWLLPTLAEPTRERLFEMRADQVREADDFGADAALLRRAGVLRASSTGESLRLCPGIAGSLRALSFLRRVQGEEPARRWEAFEVPSDEMLAADVPHDELEALACAIEQAGGALHLSQLALLFPQREPRQHADLLRAWLASRRGHPWLDASNGRVVLRAWAGVEEQPRIEEGAHELREPWLLHELSLLLALAAAGGLELREDGCRLRTESAQRWVRRQRLLPSWAGDRLARPRARQPYVREFAKRYGLIEERRGPAGGERIEPTLRAQRWFAYPIAERWRLLLAPLRVDRDELGVSSLGPGGDSFAPGELAAALSRLPRDGEGWRASEEFFDAGGARGEARSRVLRALVANILVPLGAVAVRRELDGRTQLARTPAGELLCTAGDTGKPLELPRAGLLVVQPDFSVQLLELDPAVELRLAPFAEPQGGPGGRACFALSAGSVRAAAAAGAERRELVEQLSESSAAPIPSNVLHELEHWFDTWARVMVDESGRYLCDDEERLHALLVAAGGHLRAERSAPGGALCVGDRRELVRRLQGSGIFPSTRTSATTHQASYS